VAALDAYDTTFEIPYPLPKSDMVAIPEFAAGAMENWGLVTYREVDMLIDKKTASSRQLQRVAEVVIHELAHQWFGNLVTMEWWEDLWLNEGFATWMETGVTHELYPAWSMWEQFITDMQGRALQLDALRSSHPIQVPIKRAEEVEQVFDAISYCKGGSVVRMVHAVVGEEAFVKGLRAYMKEFAYGNATTNDLWAAWQKSSGKNIPELMDAWTKQTGFPVLELQKVNSDGSLVLEQRRFFADGAADTENTKWPVPLFASVDGTQQSIGVMSSQKETVPFADAKNAKWVKLNAGQHAPLRVKYPDAMLPHLFEAISSKKLPPADRIGLLSDGAALSKAGLMPFGRFLELLGAYKNEDDATVWSQLLEKLMSLGKILRGGDDATLSEAYDGFARALIVPVLEKCGWAPRDEDAHLTRKLRGEVIAALPTFCAADDGVYAEAKRRFDAFRAGDDAALPSEYQSAVYKLVLARGDRETFDQILELREARALNEEKKSCLVESCVEINQ
jgi:puromycin-sensitive aminopeptidase